MGIEKRHGKDMGPMPERPHIRLPPKDDPTENDVADLRGSVLVSAVRFF